MFVISLVHEEHKFCNILFMILVDFKIAWIQKGLTFIYIFLFETNF